MSTISRDRGFRGVVAVLTLCTAAIHLSLNFPDPVFIMNGLGYLSLLAALLSQRTTRYHDAIRWTLGGYAALTILLWILFGARSPIGFVDKTIEVALIVVLLLWIRRRRPGG